MESGSFPVTSRRVIFRDITLPKVAVAGILPQVTPYDEHQDGRVDRPTIGKVDQAAAYLLTEKYLLN
jgi:hypothetical protein